MNSPAPHLLLQTLLARTRRRHRRAGAGLWQVSLGSDHSRSALLRLDGAWLALRVPVATRTDPAGWLADRLPELLRWNSKIRSPLKFALANDATLVLCADLSLGEAGQLGRRFEQACDGLHLAQVIALERVPLPPKSDGAAAAPARLSDALRLSLEQCGWPGRVWAEDERMLRPGQTGTPAVWIREEKGEVRLRTPLADCGDCAPASLQAISARMLTAAWTRRSIRFGLCEHHTRLTAVAETAFSAAPSPGKLCEALRVLSAAARDVGPGLQALRNNEFAMRYLTRMGFNQERKKTTC